VDKEVAREVVVGVSTKVVQDEDDRVAKETVILLRPVGLAMQAETA